MVQEAVNYKCPSCDGPLHFSAESGLLECEFCLSQFTVEQVEEFLGTKVAKAEAKAAEKAAGNDEWEKAPKVTKEEAAAKAAESAANPIGSFLERAPWSEALQNGSILPYVCSSCGAGLMADATMAVTTCPYCSNPTIVPGTLSDMLEPDYVIPFKRTKEQAKAALLEHYRSKPFTPKEFMRDSHLEHIQGLYVPFWLFTAETEVDADYEATRTRVYRTRKEEITETDWYDVHREGVVQFTKVPSDASTKMPDAHMDAIEPFDYDELKEFSVAYLPGYITERYDLDAQECGKRALGRVTASAPEVVKLTVDGYDAISTSHCDTKTHVKDVKYALLPVWMLHSTWEGKDFLFAMNGQTGKFIGDLPVSKKRVMAYFFKVFGIVAVIATIGAYFFMNFM